MAEIVINEDGSVDGTFHIEPEKVKTLLHRFEDFDAVVAGIEDSAVEESLAMEAQAGLQLYAVKRAQAKADGEEFAIIDTMERQDIIDWYREQPEWKTAADKQAEKDAIDAKRKQDIENLLDEENALEEELNS